MATPNVNSPNIHRKRALIIGNQSYTKQPLTNSVNDANDLDKALRTIGFDIELGIDCTLDEMTGLIDTFTDQIKDQDLVLFYFAGHGVQFQGENYLLPVDGPKNLD